MTVRRLLFLPGESVNAVSLFHPHLTPTLSPLSLISFVLVQCPPHHSTSLSLICLSQFSLFIPLPVCTLPLSSNPPPLHSLKPPAACGHMKHFERKRMTETDLDLCCTYMMMFVQSMSLSGLMDLHCLAGICLHATGREPFSSQLNIHNIASS